MSIFDAHVYCGETPFTNSLATRESILATLRSREITGAALFSGLAADCDFVTGNRRLREIISAQDGLFGWVMLNAGYSAESQEEQRRHETKRGIVGAAMFGHNGRPVVLEDAREILNAQRRYAKPIALHIPDGDAVHAAREIAVAFPAMKFLWLAMGGDDWRSAVATASQHLNIYLEISGSLDADKIAYASSVLTPRKLIYGSGQPHSDPSLPLALVESSSTLTRADRSRILSENAIVLLSAVADPEEEENADEDEEGQNEAHAE